MLTLEEAIAHCEEKAKELEEQAYTDFDSWTYDGKAKANYCLECAKEHEQLAEWLTELKLRREADAKKNFCPTCKDREQCKWYKQCLDAGRVTTYCTAYKENEE